MPIKILAPEVANQIAAGEVVERPASVVKELIENSLDAGATDMRVEVREGGRRLVRVQDNGCGIPAADTATLFRRHATSKISSAADLDALRTFGFRGEALASIGSVAQVTLLTRAAEEEAGTLLRVAAGHEVAREPHGTPVGTVITVEHLFANVPARLKFLKQPATETGHILQIVTRYALAYPDRRFALISDGKLSFQSTGSGKLYDVLVKVYGLETAGQMLPVELPAEEGAAVRHGGRPRVTGYTGAPSLHRSNRSYITLFVNRRWFQDGSLAYAIIQAYHTMLPVGRYPLALLFIEMDPADVDVNVHPTKAEVRFRDNSAVFSAVQRTLRRVLMEHAPIPQATWGEASPPAAPLRWEQLAAWTDRREALLGAGSGRLERSAPPAVDPHAGIPQADIRPGEPVPLTAALGQAHQAESAAPLMPLLRVVGQVAATYIVAEGPDGLYLIDQHAAHERVLYEQLVAAQSARQVASQALLEPMLLDLSPEQAAVLAEALEPLNAAGLSLEAFGGNAYLVRAVPAVLSGDNPQSAVAEILDGLLAYADVVEDNREATLVALICKRAAVKGGQVLTMAEMQELVRRLEACRAPRTCPHGRPTMIHVSAGELARLFGRI